MEPLNTKATGMQQCAAYLAHCYDGVAGAPACGWRRMGQLPRPIFNQELLLHEQAVCDDDGLCTSGSVEFDG